MPTRFRPEAARADKLIPGIWRLRLPLPWEVTPHGNAYAVEHGDGIVLFDTGHGGQLGLPQLELALRLAGFELDDIRLIACTHAHVDHFGAAASIVERVGCPLWVHPAWRHMERWALDPDGALDARLESARRNGVPEDRVGEMDRARRGRESGYDGVPDVDRELVDGVAIETDLGTWSTYETPGHAPSHVVFHLPERRILLSGDLVVGRVFLYFDYGHTPDPVGEFVASLDVVDGLDVGLCLSGHGKPFRAVPAKVDAYRAEVERALDALRASLGDRPASAYELALRALDTEAPDPAALGYALEITMALLTHLERLGEARVAGSDPRAWVRAER